MSGQQCCWALAGGYCLSRVLPPVLDRGRDGRLYWQKFSFCPSHETEIRDRVAQAERLVRVVMAQQL